MPDASTKLYQQPWEVGFITPVSDKETEAERKEVTCLRIFSSEHQRWDALSPRCPTPKLSPPPVMQGHQVVRELHLHIYLSCSTYTTLYTVGVQPSSTKLQFWKVNVEKDLQGCCLETDSCTGAGKWTCGAQSRLPERWWIPKGCLTVPVPHSVSFAVPVTELIKTQPCSNPWLWSISSCTQTYLFPSMYVSLLGWGGVGVPCMPYTSYFSTAYKRWRKQRDQHL